MIKNISTEGIVLNELRYKEKSKIVRIFTKELGKVTIMARGALSAKSPLVSVTQMFGLNQYDLIKGKSFYYIDSAHVINSNFNMRTDYDRLIMASYLLELVDKSFLDNEPNEKVFELFKKTIKILSESTEDIFKIVLAFELKYISFLGYRPNFDGEFKNPVFSVKDGGIVEKPSFYKEMCYSVKLEDIYYFKELLYTSLDKVTVDIDEKRLLYLQEIVLEYIKYNLEIREFNSLSLI